MVIAELLYQSKQGLKMHEQRLGKQGLKLQKQRLGKQGLKLHKHH